MLPLIRRLKFVPQPLTLLRSAAVAIALAGLLSPALGSAAPFVLTDSDFASEVYEIHVGGLDLTPLLGSAWLATPGLLELRFGYSLLNTDIPDSHLQLFRNDACCGGGFRLRITRVPEPSLAALLGCALLLLPAGRAARLVRARAGAPAARRNE